MQKQAKCGKSKKIHRIIDKKKADKKPYYKVKWVGLSSSQNQWLSKQYIVHQLDGKDAIKTFEKMKKELSIDRDLSDSEKGQEREREDSKKQSGRFLMRILLTEYTAQYEQLLVPVASSQTNETLSIQSPLKILIKTDQIKQQPHWIYGDSIKRIVSVTNRTANGNYKPVSPNEICSKTIFTVEWQNGQTTEQHVDLLVDNQPDKVEGFYKDMIRLPSKGERKHR